MMFLLLQIVTTGPVQTSTELTSGELLTMVAILVAGIIGVFGAIIGAKITGGLLLKNSREILNEEQRIRREEIRYERWLNTKFPIYNETVAWGWDMVYIFNYILNNFKDIISSVDEKNEEKFKNHMAIFNQKIESTRTLYGLREEREITNPKMILNRLLPPTEETRTNYLIFASTAYYTINHLYYKKNTIKIDSDINELKNISSWIEKQYEILRKYVIEFTISSREELELPEAEIIWRADKINKSE